MSKKRPLSKEGSCFLLTSRSIEPSVLCSTIRFRGTLSSTKQGAKVTSEDIAEKAQPFSALNKASSLIVAILYLAGFSFRWGYYYNFGVQHLVLNLSFQSILTASMEMIRLPRNLLMTTVSLVGTLLIPESCSISPPTCRAVGSSRSAAEGGRHGCQNAGDGESAGD